MAEAGNTACPASRSNPEDCRIRSLQRLLVDLASFFDHADDAVCDRVEAHLGIGDAAGWLSVVLIDHADALGRHPGH